MISCATAGYMERYTKSLAKQAVAEYAAVAKKHGLTPTELALAWCKGKWQVTSTIIGATSMEQLKVRTSPSHVFSSLHELRAWSGCCVQADPCSSAGQSQASAAVMLSRLSQMHNCLQCLLGWQLSDYAITICAERVSALCRKTLVLLTSSSLRMPSMTLRGCTSGSGIPPQNLLMTEDTRHQGSCNHSVTML